MHLKNKNYKKENKPILQIYILKTVKPLKIVGISVRHCLDISLCAVTSTGRTRAWVSKSVAVQRFTLISCREFGMIWLGECGTVEACRAPYSASSSCGDVHCSGALWEGIGSVGFFSQAVSRAPHNNYRCHRDRGQSSTLSMGKSHLFSTTLHGPVRLQ